ncbi:hypothetical protein ABFS83_08G176500 [Erythranthe nasuta]
MRNDGQKSGDGGGGAMVPRSSGGRGNNGIIPNSFKTLSSYLKIVSSGASTVASTVRSAASAASAIVERDGESSHDQVTWAGFDKLEVEKGVTKQVLLLGYSYGFQVWDVEEADNVRNLVTRQDGPVSFMQVLPKPEPSKQSKDEFSDNRPLLIVCADGSFSGDINNVHEGPGQVPVNGSYVPTVVWFYSLRSQSYVHLLRFRSAVHLVRSSSRVVAVLQSSQIHCLNAATFEKEYTILTNPVTSGSYGSIGVGPLAVGPRWMAYSGSPVAVSNSRRVTPQHLTGSSSFSSQTSNGSLVAHYARESSKQLAAGIVTLGDMGYKKLSRYYSDLSEGNSSQSGIARVKVHGGSNGHLPDADNVGMVIVRDIVSKNVIAQFTAHKSPISSLCFDPTGTLLVTASVQGHNINVFRIMPSSSSEQSYVHLYRLQRGITDAVIQDISFSSDSQWIMISSLRGTSHLFAISPSGGLVDFSQSTDARLQALTRQSISASGPTVTLSAVSRIRSGNSSNGWRNTVSGAAAAATGRLNSLSGAIASVFHNCKGNNDDFNSPKKSYYLLVFSPGCVVQYALRFSPASNGTSSSSALREASFGGEFSPEGEMRLVVEAIQKWNICQKQNRKEQQGDSIDVYGENGNPDSSKVYPERNNYLSSDVLGKKTVKEKITNEEKHKKYISEAELQMHRNPNPLWGRPEVYFQSMVSEGSNVNEGEIEIERVAIRTLEARSKDLVPVYDYLQFQQGRSYVKNSEKNGRIQPRGSGSESDGVDLLGETSRGISVNTNDRSTMKNTRVASVVNTTTRENSVRESQIRSVHNRDGSNNMDNGSAEVDQFD